MNDKKWGGVAYPWGPELRTFFEDKSDTLVLKAAVINLLLTRRGERVMMPEFGSPIPDLVFEPNDDVAIAQVQAALRDAIERWDDRLELVNFNYEALDNQLILKIMFRDSTDPVGNKTESVELQISDSLLTAVT